VAPKTLGALYPEKLALPAALIYQVLLKGLYPVVWATNLITNGVLRLAGITREKASATSLSREELRTVVAEASTVIPHRHQRMLMSILDLERINVEDIMVPLNEIAGLDVSDEWDDILGHLRDSRHTRIPVYDGSIDELVGILHMKQVARLLARGELDREQLVGMARSREPYYVPEGTSLNTQLLNFQRQRRRMAFVVDEYGDVQGLVTLEDLLEEIVGEIRDEHDQEEEKFVELPDGYTLVDSRVEIEAFEKHFGAEIPRGKYETLGGFILDTLKRIPMTGDVVHHDGLEMVVASADERSIKKVRIRKKGETR
jgi:Mg2+/Co2+ transporter CorB